MSEQAGSGKKQLIGGVIVVVLIVAAVIIFAQTRPTEVEAVEQQWFYDVGTGETFTTGIESVPPIAAPSGATLPSGQPGGVKAYVYSCDNCDNAESHFVGYVSTPSPDAAKDPRGAAYYRETAVLVATPPADAAAGQSVELDWQPQPQMIANIEADMKARCNGKTPIQCHPSGK